MPRCQTVLGASSAHVLGTRPGVSCSGDLDYYEGTVGGPILRTRLWFFGAGTWEKSTQTRTFQETGAAYDRTVDNKRYDVSGTATPWANQTFQMKYTDNDTEQINNPGLALSIDPRVLVTRQLPNTLFVTNWNGVLSPALFATLQYSQKTFDVPGGLWREVLIRESGDRRIGACPDPPDRLMGCPYALTSRRDPMAGASGSWSAGDVEEVSVGAEGDAVPRWREAWRRRRRSSAASRAASTRSSSPGRTRRVVVLATRQTVSRESPPMVLSCAHNRPHDGRPSIPAPVSRLQPPGSPAT